MIVDDSEDMELNSSDEVILSENDDDGPSPISRSKTISKKRSHPLSKKEFELDGKFYNATTLKLMNNKPLSQHCKTLKQPHSGNKNEMVERIVNYKTDRTINSDESQLLHQIQTAQKDKVSDLHIIYKKSFNFQDKYNRKWNEFMPHFRMVNWISKCLLAVLMGQLANAFAIYTDKTNADINFHDFIEQIVAVKTSH